MTNLVAAAIVHLPNVADLGPNLGQLFLELDQHREVFFQGVVDVGHCVRQGEVGAIARLLQIIPSRERAAPDAKQVGRDEPECQ